MERSTQPKVEQAVRPAARALHPGVSAALLLTLGVWVSLAWHRFGYMHDDLIMFSAARDYGFSRELLTMNLFEHFAPLDHAMYAVELAISPLDPAVGVAIVAVILTGMLLSLDWLLRELGASGLRRALSVAFLGTSIVTLLVTTYWGQAIYIPPASTAMLLTLAAHVRGIRTRRIRWHVGTVIFAIVGFLISERTLFVVGFAVLVDLLVVDRDTPWSARLRLLWARKWSLGVLLLVCVSGAVFIRLKYYVDYPAGQPRDILGLLGAAWTKWLIPAMLGFYSPAGAPRIIALLIAGATFAAAAILIRVRPANAGPILLIGFVYAVDYLFLGFGRLGIFSIQSEGADLQYIAWVLPFIAVGVALIEVPGVSARGVRAIARNAVVAGVAVCVVMNLVRYAHDDMFMNWHEYAWEYMSALRDGRSQWASPSGAVVPLRAPGQVEFFDPFGRHEVLLPIIAPGLNVGALPDGGGAPVFIDSTGHVQSAVLQVAARLDGLDLETAVIQQANTTWSRQNGVPCISATGPEAYVRFALPVEVVGSPLLVHLTWDVATSTVVQFITVAPSGNRMNGRNSQLPSQGHEALFPLDGDDVAQLQVSGLASGGTVCLRSVSVVRPLFRTPDGRCLKVTLVGAIEGPPLACDGKPN